VALLTALADGRNGVVNVYRVRIDYLDFLKQGSSNVYSTKHAT